MARDSQRQKVYDAEDAVFTKRKSEGMSVAECQAFLDKCQQGAWLRKRYPRALVAVTVKDGRGCRRGFYTPGWAPTITLPRWARSRWVVLHELAHHLVYRRVDPWHGWRFCECYLYLVRVFLGRHVEERLEQEFRAHRVKWRKPRTREMSDEQRQAARERMLAMHAARQKAAV